MVSAVVSALHLLALALGLPSVFLRGRALKGPLDREGLRRLFAAGNVWGIAAALWLVTGLLRAFAGLDKGTAFYLASWLFWRSSGCSRRSSPSRSARCHPHPLARRAGPRHDARHVGGARALSPQPRRAGARRAHRLRRRLHGPGVRAALTRYRATPRKAAFQARLRGQQHSAGQGA